MLWRVNWNKQPQKGSDMLTDNGSTGRTWVLQAVCSYRFLWTSSWSPEGKRLVSFSSSRSRPARRELCSTSLQKTQNSVSTCRLNTETRHAVPIVTWFQWFVLLKHGVWVMERPNIHLKKKKKKKKMFHNEALVKRSNLMNLVRKQNEEPELYENYFFQNKSTVVL